MSEDITKTADLEAWAHEIVTKIVEAERMGGGFRLYFETAEKAIVDKIREERRRCGC